MPTNFDDENKILDYLNGFETNECLIISDKIDSDNYKKTAKIIESLLDENYKNKWEDNSKSLLPPDFINKKDNIMMEVMRVDDHSSDGKNNPVLKKEKQMHKELSEILKILPETVSVFCNPVTDLPTEVDHNYTNYYLSFQRAVRKHASKITKYRKNHPNKELIFLVMDETSGAYFQKKKLLPNKLHYVFFDNRFVSEFVNLDIDYLIMFMPYNYFNTLGNHNELPHIVIFDIKHLKNGKMMKYINYDETKMISSEK